MEDCEITYSILPRTRLPEVNEFLLGHFFSHEPLGVALGACPETDVRPWLAKVTKPIVDQKVRKFAHLMANVKHHLWFRTKGTLYE